MLVVILNLTIDDVIQRYDNLNTVKADVVFYYKSGRRGNSEYENQYYSRINKDIWKGEMTYQNNQFYYNFISQKKGKPIELFISVDLDQKDYTFEFKYDNKIQRVNAWNWAYFAIYKAPKALKELGYEVIQNGNWFIFKKGIRELRIYIDNNYKILRAEYYKRGAIKGILEFRNVIIE